MIDKRGETSGDALFLDKCRPKLKALETLRLEKLKDFLRRKKIATPLAVILTPICGFIDRWLLILQRGNEDSLAGVTILVLGLLWGWATQPKREYARAYKAEILPEIARLYGNFQYDVKGKVPMATMKSSGIMPSHTRYWSEDCFTGEYQGVGINFSEIHLSKKKGKNTVTVFKGLAVLFTHGTRKFHGHTVLTKDQNNAAKWVVQKKLKLKRANMVDLEFERLFDVFTNDQVEARYLIDPVIIENLKTLYSEYSGTKMGVSFYDDHVLILIGSGKNHFEPPNIKTVATSEAEFLALKREIDQILSIIERLSLYDPTTKRLAKPQRSTSPSLPQ